MPETYSGMFLLPFCILSPPLALNFPPFRILIPKKSDFFTQKTYFFDVKNQIFSHLLSQRAKIKPHGACGF